MVAVVISRCEVMSTTTMTANRQGMSKGPAGDHAPGTAAITEVIKEVLNNHSYIHEKRIQKLLFLADLLSIQTRGNRLIDADFKPYYYGVFSDSVSLSLQSMKDVKTAVTRAPDGTDVLAFLKPDKPYKTALSTDQRKLVDETIVAYRQCSTEQLAEIGKHSLLWESSDHGQPFDYSKYLEDPTSRMSPAMTKAFVSAHRDSARGKLRTARTVRELLKPLLTS
jgi:uncharacterized phage-associated protein